jgi:hypothetical protein
MERTVVGVVVVHNDCELVAWNRVAPPDAVAATKPLGVGLDAGVHVARNLLQN